MEVLIQSSFISAVASLLIALSAIRGKKRLHSTMSLATLCLVHALFQISFVGFLVTSSRAILAVQLSAQVWVGTLLLLFLSRFVLSGRVIALGPILFGTTLASLIPLTAPADTPLLETLRSVYAILQWGLFTYATILVAQAIQTRTDPVELNKLKLILVATILALLFSILDFLRTLHFPAPAYGGIVTSVYLYLLFRLIPIATIKDIREVVANGFRGTVICLVISLILLVMTGWARHHPELYFFNSFLAALIIMFGFPPFQNRIESLFLKYFFRDQQAIHDMLDRLDPVLVRARTPTELFSMIQEAVKRSAGVENLHFYKMKSGTADTQSFFESPDVESPYLDAQSPIYQFIERFQSPVHVEQLRFELSRRRFRNPEERLFLKSVLDQMEEYSFSVVIPIFATQKLAGFVAIQIPRHSQLHLHFSQEETRLMERMIEKVMGRLEQLRYFEKQNEQARLAILGEMSAALAHEIKNPLAAVKGAAGMAKEFTDSRRQKYLNIISDEIDRLDIIVNQFLNVAKQADLDYVGDVASVVERCVLLGISNRDSHGIEIKAVPIGPGPFRATIDPARLQQVILNLVNNSIDAIRNAAPPRTAPKIEIKYQSEDQRIVIEVSDNGPGIEPENLERIFVPFFTTKDTGSGLGLPISERIIALFGGTLTAESVLGQGTTFRIELRSHA